MTASMPPNPSIANGVAPQGFTVRPPPPQIPRTRLNTRIAKRTQVPPVLYPTTVRHQPPLTHPRCLPQRIARGASLSPSAICNPQFACPQPPRIAKGTQELRWVTSVSAETRDRFRDRLTGKRVDRILSSGVRDGFWPIGISAGLEET